MLFRVGLHGRNGGSTQKGMVGPHAQESTNWIVNTKKVLQLHGVDTVINFESTRFFLPPEVPSPTIKFKPPKVE
jgi:hypothetical protein